MKEKLVITGFMQKDKYMKNKNNLSMADRFGLLVQDPHASVYGIPTREKIRAHN